MADKQAIEALKTCVEDLRTICKTNGIPFFCIMAPFENPEKVGAAWYIPKTTNALIKNIRMEYALNVVETPELEEG